MRTVCKWRDEDTRAFLIELSRFEIPLLLCINYSSTFRLASDYTHLSITAVSPIQAYVPLAITTHLNT